jgi:hypothetical protein
MSLGEFFMCCSLNISRVIMFNAMKSAKNILLGLLLSFNLMGMDDQKPPEWFLRIMEDESIENFWLIGHSFLPMGLSLQEYTDELKNTLSQKASPMQFEVMSCGAQETAMKRCFYIIEIMTKSKLKVFHHSNSDFSDKEMCLLADNLHNKMIPINISFSSCDITKEGVLVLMKALKNNYRLQHFGFDPKLIEKDTYQEIKTILERNKALEKIIKNSIPIIFLIGFDPADGYYLHREIMNNIVLHLFLHNLYNYQSPTFLERKFEQFLNWYHS